MESKTLYRILAACVAVIAVLVGLTSLRHKGNERTPVSQKETKTTAIEVISGPATPARVVGARSESTAIERAASRREARVESNNFIAGRVTSADGAAVAGAQVRVRDNNTSTDLAGNYRIDNIRETTASRVSVWHNDFQSAEQRNVATNRSDVDFTLTPKKKIEFIGHVLDWKTSAPLASYEVKMERSKVEYNKPKPGDFRVAEVNAGDRYDVEITAPGYVPLKAEVGIRGESESPSERTFTMGPGAVLKGRVIEKATSSPLSGVEIARQERSRDSDRRSSETLRTDGEGRFEFTMIPPGEYRVYVYPQLPLAQTNRTAGVQHGSVTDMGDISLTNGATVQGRVLRVPGDLPVSGQSVELADMRGSWGRGGSSSSQRRQAVTDAKGEFRIEGVTPGAYRIRIDEPEVQQSVFVRDEETEDVTLRIGAGILRGLIVQRGQPIGGMVRIARRAESDAGQTIRTEDGTFEVSGLAPGHWEVSIFAGGGDQRWGNRATDSFEMPDSGILEKTFVIPSGIIAGRVVDLQDAPVREAVILKLVDDPGLFYSSIPTRTRSVTTGDDGSFRLEGLTPGAHSIYARKDSLGSSQIETVTVPADGEASDVILRVDKGQTGTLVSTALNFSTGGPVQNAWCLLTSDKGRMGHGQQRNERGILTIRDLPVGTYRVQVSASGFSIGEHTVTIRAGQTETLTDVLYESGALHWSLVDGNGSGVQGIRVRLEPQDADTIESPRDGVTDAGGLWVSRGLMPGNYVATATTARTQLRIPIIIRGNQLTTKVNGIDGSEVASSMSEGRGGFGASGDYGGWRGGRGGGDGRRGRD